jgi:hypothetical protein
MIRKRIVAFFLSNEIRQERFKAIWSIRNLR